MSEDLDDNNDDMTITTVKDAIRRGFIRVCSVLEKGQVVENFDKDAFLAGVPGATSLVELRALLGDLEAAIDQAYLHSNFARDPLLVRHAWITVGSEVATVAPGSSFADQMLSPDKIKGACADAGRLAWLPPTAPSISLRLMALDASILYRNETCGRVEMAEFRATQRPFLNNDVGVVETMLLENSHVEPAVFPPYPYRLSFSPRMDFLLDCQH